MHLILASLLLLITAPVLADEIEVDVEQALMVDVSRSMSAADLDCEIGEKLRRERDLIYDEP